MAFEKAFRFLEQRGFAGRVSTFEISSATVELAAIAVGTEPARIEKSLTFLGNGTALMIVCAGDVKVNSAKYKERFGIKAKMLSHELVHEMIGHDVGGVCPFGTNEDVRVYLDESLKRFKTVFPACGSDNSAVRLSPEELQLLTGAEWVDVCVPMAEVKT